MRTNRILLKAWRSAMFLLLLGQVRGVAAAAVQQPVPGMVTERVTCVRDPAQSYSLYLPSRYSTDRKWPIVYALDPGARGVLPVQRFRDAAEKYGYIIAGSNNSRNGPIKVVEDAVNALITDAESRYSLDAGRVYFAGFSGGARASVAIGYALKGKVAGVIACGAGFPPNIEPSPAVPFSLFVAVGTEDFYFPELQALDRLMDGYGTPHSVEISPGGHEWPPDAVCRDALEWMEVQGMKSGIRAMDAALIAGMISRRETDAQACETEKRLYDAFRLYDALARDFDGLKDVSVYKSKAMQLERARDVRRAMAEEKDVGARQKRAEKEIYGLISDAVADRDRLIAMQRLNNRFETLRKDARQTKRGIDRLVAARLLTRFWILLDEEVSADFQEKRYGAAAARLELMAGIRPDNPQLYYHLARACSLWGRKKEAIKALETAVTKGFQDGVALERNEDFAILRQEEGYLKILATLRK